MPKMEILPIRMEVNMVEALLQNFPGKVNNSGGNILGYSCPQVD
jgi:hypothetical protein